MNEATVRRLMALNQRFYATLAGPFAHSRAHMPTGFERLAAYLPTVCGRVLDVGCGEGRWGRFVLAQRPQAHYVGVDFAAELLAAARAQLLTAGYEIPPTLQQQDITALPADWEPEPFDVIACLGVLHHIPGRANRQRLMEQLGGRLAVGGRLFLSNWQFTRSVRQRRKIRPWSEVGLSPADVEPGDYLLSWERGGSGRRYVCLIDAGETAELALAAGCRILTQFEWDGREGNLNLYTILERLTPLSGQCYNPPVEATYEPDA